MEPGQKRGERTGACLFSLFELRRAFCLSLDIVTLTVQLFHFYSKIMTEAFVKHQPTLLLIQLYGESSRTYLNYSCLAYAFDGIADQWFPLDKLPDNLSFVSLFFFFLFTLELLNLFEQKLKQERPNWVEADLLEFDRFIDQLPDLVIMLFDCSNGCFEAHAKNWIKQKAYEFLRCSTKFQVPSQQQQQQQQQQYQRQQPSNDCPAY